MNIFQFNNYFNENPLNLIAATLDKKEPATTWQSLEWEPDQRLQLRQIMLGHTAKENEYNVIEVNQFETFYKILSI